MSAEPCPDCDGSGRFYIPSDGYENSKSGRCDSCRGEGTLLAYAKRELPTTKLRLEGLVKHREVVTMEIDKLTRIVESAEKILED